MSYTYEMKQLIKRVEKTPPHGLAKRKECREFPRMSLAEKEKRLRKFHPSQVEVVYWVFTPTVEEVTYVKRVIEAFEKAQAEGRAATQLDGELIENIHVAVAQRILRIAEKSRIGEK